MVLAPHHAKVDHSMVTIRDVAKHAGVSVATVSRVINGTGGVSDQTVRRVQQSIQALGFEPDFLAQSWRTRVTRTLAAVVVDNTSPHHSIMLREAGRVALAHDYSLILCTTYFDPEVEHRYLRMLRLRRVDGILLNSTGDCREDIRKLTEAGIPVVMLNRPLDDYGALVDAVVVDSYAGSFALVDHLIRSGHRRIALAYHETLNEYHKYERLRGYQDALHRHGLPYDEDLVFCGNFANGPDALCDCLNMSPRPTALFAASYNTGLAAMSALHAQGLHVPDDMAFAMFDDVMWGAFVDPPLTLVCNPAEDVGRTAMELLFARLADRSRPPQEIKLKPRLVLRRSCGWTGPIDESYVTNRDAIPMQAPAVPVA
jgi:LacI family transcriptional regulator